MLTEYLPDSIILLTLTALVLQAMLAVLTWRILAFFSSRIGNMAGLIGVIVLLILTTVLFGDSTLSILMLAGGALWTITLWRRDDSTYQEVLPIIGYGGVFTIIGFVYFASQA